MKICFCVTVGWGKWHDRKVGVTKVNRGSADCRRAWSGVVLTAEVAGTSYGWWGAPWAGWRTCTWATATASAGTPLPADGQASARGSSRPDRGHYNSRDLCTAVAMVSASSVRRAADGASRPSSDFISHFSSGNLM